MRYMVLRWNMLSRTYEAMSQRFDTYPDAETFGADCHRKAVESKRFHHRFIPISEDRYPQTLARNGQRVHAA